MVLFSGIFRCNMSNMTRISAQRVRSFLHAGGLAVGVAFFYTIAVPAPLLGATYYIDSAGGADTNNGTSTNSPWKHVKGMTGCSNVCSSTTLAGGDKVIFKGGVTWTSSFPWTIVGGSSSNITYTTDHSWYAGSSWSQPVFDDGNANPGATGMANMSGTGFVTLNDFTWTKCGVQGAPDMSNKCLVFENTHDITITNSVFTTYAWISIYFLLDSAGTYSNFTVTGNDFSGTSGAIWMASAQPSTVAANFIYNNNVFHDFSSQIGNGTHGDGSLHYFSTHTSGEYLDGFQFISNRFYGDFRRSAGSDGAMTGMIYLEGAVKNGVIANNDMSFSPVQASMFQGLIVLSTGCATTGCGVGIYNNTLVNIGTNAMSDGIDLFYYPNVTVKNNIVYGMQYPTYVQDSTSTTGYSSDYNLYSGTSGELIYGGSFQSYATWQAGGRDVHGSLGTTPSFVSAPGNERLNAGSAGIGLGTNLTSLGIAALNVDLAGVARPATGAWDVGAFQFTSTSTPNPPSALTVIVQ